MIMHIMYGYYLHAISNQIYHKMVLGEDNFIMNDTLLDYPKNCSNYLDFLQVHCAKVDFNDCE